MLNMKKHNFSKNLIRDFTLLVLAFLLGISAAAQPRRQATQAEKAARVDAIFKSLKEKAPKEKKLPMNSRVQISEDELNAYLDEEYRSKTHIGMKSAVVKLFDASRVAADSVIDVDEIKSEGSVGLKMISLLFSGDQTLHAEAKMIFNGNTVTYQLERAQLNGVTLPNPLVEKLIEILARKQSQKIDVTKPIPLSDTIKHVEVRQGLLLIQT